VGTRYTVTVSCDERAAPDCTGETSVTLVGAPDGQRHLGALFRQGWRLGCIVGHRPHTYDVCPACAALTRPRAQGRPGPRR
jgi:hypothetical protein